MFFTSLRKSEGRRQAKNRHARVALSRAVSAHRPPSPSPSPSRSVPSRPARPIPFHSIPAMSPSSLAYPSIHPFRAPAARNHCNRKRKPPPETMRILHSIKFSSQGQIAHHLNSIRIALSLIPSRTGALAYLAAVLIVHVIRIVSRTLAQISLTV